MNAFRNLQIERVVITGGTRGLGLRIVEALVAAGTSVTVIARDRAGLDDVKHLGVEVRPGDATDPMFMDQVVAEVEPTILILNAGAIPVLAPINEQTWDEFCTVWNTDVKAGLYGIQAALKTPLSAGARVLVTSAGAARHGAPLSGSLTGAKQMLWFMAHYANDIAKELRLDIHFQVLVPMQMVAETVLGKEVLGAYARRAGTSIEAILDARYGKVRLSARQYGNQVVKLLSDPKYATGVAYGFRADTGITSLDD